MGVGAVGVKNGMPKACMPLDQGRVSVGVWAGSGLSASAWGIGCMAWIVGV
jgi:hypothetical protein